MLACLRLAAAPASRPAKRRRFRIPFLMPVILLAVIVALAAIWRLHPGPFADHRHDDLPEFQL